VLTLFRPDLRFADSFGMGLVQSVLALPIVIWFLVALRSRAHWNTIPWLFVVFLVLYVAPFSLTKAVPHPRFSEPT
jgi:hypothetical protein